MSNANPAETHRETWGTYAKSWAEPDPAKRLGLFEQCLDTACVYTDPQVQTNGYEPLAGYMAELHRNVPGVRFVTLDFQVHHDRCLTHWHMVGGDGGVISPGVSYGFFGPDGRLRQMTGFFQTRARQ